MTDEYDIDFDPDLMVLGLEYADAVLLDSDGNQIPESAWTDEQIQMAGDLFVAGLYKQRELARMH